MIRGLPRRSITVATTPNCRRCRETSSRSTRSTTAPLTIRDEALAPWPRTPEVVRQHLADYYASITFLDAAGRPHPRCARGERPVRQHAHRLHQRPWPGHRQPRALRQAEPLRPLDAFAAHHRRPGHPQRAAVPTRCATCSTSSPRWASSTACPAPEGNEGRSLAPSRRHHSARSRLDLHRLRQHAARRPRRPLEAHRVSQGQQDPALRPPGRSDRDARPGERPEPCPRTGQVDRSASRLARAAG